MATDWPARQRLRAWSARVAVVLAPLRGEFDRWRIRRRIAQLQRRGVSLQRFGRRIQAGPATVDVELDRWIESNRETLLELLPDQLPRRRARRSSSYWERPLI